MTKLNSQELNKNSNKSLHKGPSIYDIRFLEAIFDLPTHPSPIFC